MKKKRFRKPLAVAAGFIFLCTAPGLTRAQSGPSGPAQTSTVVSSGAQPKKNSLPPDDFAGLTYSDSQKAEIDKIYQATKARKDAVVKDERLNADQKDAMLQGYSRIEYGQVYKVLTREQQNKSARGCAPVDRQSRRRRIRSPRKNKARLCSCNASAGAVLV